MIRSYWNQNLNVYITYLVLFLIVLILSSCNMNNKSVSQLKENLHAQMNEEANLPAAGEEPNGGATTKRSSKIETEIKQKSIEPESNLVEEIKPITKIPEIDLESHVPMSLEILKEKLNGLPMVGPTYAQHWRVQPVMFERKSSGIFAVLEFANTGSKDLTINSTNVFFVRFNGIEGGDIAKSSVENGSVTIKPNKVKRVTVQSSNPEVSMLYLSLDGVNRQYYFPREENLINDAKPFDRKSTFPFPMALYLFELEGNGKFKYQTQELIMTDNAQFGPLKKSDGKMLLLVKLRLANTSAEKMVINEIKVGSSRVNSSFDFWKILKAKDFTSLGDKALPMNIEPYSIVEGYVPVLYRDGSESISFGVDSNFGKFVVAGIERYSPFNKMEKTKE
ncbi:hypothetical protein [Brevibacillus borstelensis]|uniref:hypothetical protein n=1 Tax=Brevibacillus borstelensis TaxID=45462 RepID=UPI00204122B3|nr:hypothetical protein [Brevibacillus borstelensis]MCM3473578.1 hypothetical protein [Brevibacillus borstelensis]MED1855014.1 hypothetical protein [Brevibacillus borstelensis]